MMREYRTISKIASPLMAVKSVSGVTCGELAEVELSNGDIRRGKVLEISGDCAVVQFFDRADGISPASSKVRFTGRPPELAVSVDMLGRVFSGMGNPLDGGPEILADAYMNINGLAANPAARELPNEFVQTGISAIDGLNPLILGQKLAIFSGAGLPHARLAAQLACQAKVLGDDSANFAIVFAAVGITFDESEYFIQALNKTGAISRSVVFSSLAGESSAERVLTPRMALTAAEYLAFEKDMHVLVVMTDMTSYAETLREISAARRETSSLLGYPNYLRTDFASIYERAGRRVGKKGSITLLPILTMPEDDKTHPVPDMTGYTTEGQIVLSRDLHRKGIYPPIDALPSLSRLRDKNIGAGKTREDHPCVANQLLASYSAGRNAEDIMSVLGECALSPADLSFAKFAATFEKRFITQGNDESRPIADTLKLGWDLLSTLPKGRLTQIKSEYLEKHLPQSEHEVD